MLEKLRFEPPQATRAFGGGICFRPGAVAAQKKKERSCFHLWVPALQTPPSSESSPHYLSGYWRSHGPSHSADPSPAVGGPCSGRGGAATWGASPLCVGSPHFAIVIKLLADQSLVGTAGVLEGKRKRAETFSAHASPPPGCSLACLSLPSASYVCQGQRSWTKDWGGIPESSLAG